MIDDDRRPLKDGQRAMERDDVLPAWYRECFGCGDNNEAGVRLQGIHRDGELVRAEFRSRADHQGFPGMLHGGATTAALDEMMSYACILIAGVWCATATLELRFRHPVPIDALLHVEAGLEGNAGRRRFKAWARLLDAQRRELSSAKALFVAVSDEVLAANGMNR